jgi:hypothetical protein
VRREGGTELENFSEAETGLNVIEVGQVVDSRVLRLSSLSASDDVL